MIEKCCNMIKRFLTVFCLLFSVVPNNTNGQGQEAKASLDTNVILIGKQVQLTLELKQDKKLNIQWPVIPDTLNKIEIVNRGNIDTVISNDANVLHRKQSFTITAFDSGFFVIPPFEFQSANGAIATTSNPLLLTVLIMPIDTTKAIHDIKGLAEVPFSWRDYINYILMGVGALILILIGIYLYLRFGKKVKIAVFPTKPKILAHEIALAALRKLDEEKHWQNGRYKYYHSAISEIIRNFIEEQWQVHAMEQTTDEILNQPHILELEVSSRQQLEVLLKLSDLAKFAKHQPLANENEQSMRDAVLFVKEHALLIKDMEVQKS